MRLRVLALCAPILGIATMGTARAQTPGDGAAPAPAPSSAPPPSAPPSGGPPGQYYVEPPPGGGSTAPAPAQQPGGAYEPPPPGYGYGYGYGPAYVYEPPPPPKPHHVAPKTSLWLGARAGWFMPFGNAWFHCTDAACTNGDGVKWTEFASPGPLFELDGGMRLGRYYNVFALWEHASLGNGSADPSNQSSANTDYYALGLRFSSDPDHVGFLTEINIGFRRFHAIYDDGSEDQLTNAPLEFRIGLGADIRISRAFTIEPLATLGAGSFGDAQHVDANGKSTSLTGGNDQQTGHAWATLQLGAHFDIAGSHD